jgi:hypothetical protein
MDIGAVLWIVGIVSTFVLFVWWADRQNKRHPGNRLGDWGGRMPELKLPDPMDHPDDR